MPTADFSTSKVGQNEQSSSVKFDNFVQAVEDALNSIDNSNVAAAASILVSKLAAGANGQVLSTVAGVPTWSAASASSTVGFGTSLPGSPSDGDQFILVDSTGAPTYQWLLRYVSAKSSNKWIVIGGVPAEIEVAAAEATASSVYTALATAGPSFTVPVAGDYLVTVGSQIKHSTTTGNQAAYHSYDVGGTGAADVDGALLGNLSNGSTYQGSAMATTKKTGLAANTALVSKYRNTGSETYTFGSRRMIVMPIALGG